MKHDVLVLNRLFLVALLHLLLRRAHRLDLGLRLELRRVLRGLLLRSAALPHERCF